MKSNFLLDFKPVENQLVYIFFISWPDIKIWSEQPVFPGMIVF